MADGMIEARQLAGAASARGADGAIADTAKPTPVARRTPSGRRRGSRVPRELIGFAMRWIDAGALVLTAVTGLTLGGHNLLTSRIIDVLPFAGLVVASLLALSVSDAYRLVFSRAQIDHVIRAGLAGAFGFAIALGIAWLSESDAVMAALRTAVAGWTVLLVLHGLYLLVINALSRSGRLNENVVIVGATPNARKLINRNAAARDLNIVGVFDDRLSRAPDDIAGVPVLGRIDDMLDWDHLPDIDRIIVTVTSNARERVRELIDRLRVLPQRVVLLLDLDGFDPENESLARIANSPAAYVSGAPHDEVRALSKRASDIILASVLLVFFSPILLLTALAIRLEDGGPIFFRQDRHGFNNQVIRVWKFRSMRPDKAAETRMSQQTLAGDPRITRVGAIIRRTSLDELPQLINVLKGDMSMVGPRPHAIGMTAQQTEVHAIVSDYAHRYRVKPGITGWAQINGSRGPVHTKDEVRERVRLDMEYVNRSSFWFDLWIMLITAPCLLGDSQKQR